MPRHGSAAPEYARLRAAYDAHARSQGIDLRIGRRTHRLFRDAGLTDIDVDRPFMFIRSGTAGARSFGTSSTMCATS